MSLLEALLSGMAANDLGGLDADAARAIVEQLTTSEPGRIAALDATAALHDDQRLREEIMGALRMVKSTGAVAIDDALFDAMRLVTFDRGAGRIRVGDVAIEAPMLREMAGTDAVAGETKYRSLDSDEKMRRGVDTGAQDEQSNL